MNNFDKAMDYILVNEGGYANVRHDRGGATNFGITMATLSRHRKKAVSVQDVKDLTVDEAGEIYWDYYWLPNSLDQVKSAPICICIFDIGIVRGVTVGAKYAQEICSYIYEEPLAIDGHIGPKSIASLNSVSEKRFVELYSDRAEQGFRGIVKVHPNQEKFLKGWIARAMRLRSLV